MLTAAYGGAVARTAAKTGVVAIVCFPTRAYFYIFPVAAAAIFALAVTLLLLTRLTGDRTMVRFDAMSISVYGPRGPATILWSSVEDVAVQKVSFLNSKVRLASGLRHNLVMRGARNCLVGPNTRYNQINLLGLDGHKLAELVSRLVQLQAGETQSSAARRHPPNDNAPRRRTRPEAAPTLSSCGT